jgi:uncharacterized protein (TIGR00369 family)
MTSKEEIVTFLATEFPQSKISVVDVGNAGAVVRHEVSTEHLRPGGIVSGPLLMTVADSALYVAILGEIGLIPLAVTTSFNINFLRKPSADKAILGVCKLLKVGKNLVIGEVSIFSEGQPKPVAHAVGTYSIPPQKIQGR